MKTLILVFLLTTISFSQRQSSASLFTSYGKYFYSQHSNSRNSKSVGFYGTFVNGHSSSYSVGADVLTLSDKNQHENFFLQQLFVTRGAWWIDGKWSATLHSALLHENSYEYRDAGFLGADSLFFFPSNNIYFGGGGTMFHYSPTTTLSLNGTISYSNAEIYSKLFTLKYSAVFPFGITEIFSIDACGLQTTPLLVSFRNQITYAFTTVFIHGKVMWGRRRFFFDEASLTLFSQREQQNASYAFGIGWLSSKSFSLLASVTVEKFDAYSVAYVSLGAKYNSVFR
ncbi:MAG: hypothetical protein FJ218_08985 [Ignavibacteria bacterium]|nr:hypothetical protein [Ignavibacteria bacterium]